jgi:hypothetical protein
MTHEQVEGAAYIKRELWEQAVSQRQLLQQIPRQPARWQQWTGAVLVLFGEWLRRRGERIAGRSHTKHIAVVE